MDRTNGLFQLFNEQNNMVNQFMLQNFDFLENINDENTTRKYTVFPRVDPFIRYNDNDFRNRFRMSKECVHQLFNLLDGRITLDPQVKRL